MTQGRQSLRKARTAAKARTTCADLTTLRPATAYRCVKAVSDTGAEMAGRRQVQVEVLDLAAVEDMAGKVRAVGELPQMSDEVRRWRDDHAVTPSPGAHSFVVVGETLMYLHSAPDGTVLPHACYPDGTEKVYTDFLHAESASD